MSRKVQVIRLAEKRGLIGAKDLESRGISRNYLYLLHKEGVLERVGAGSYALADAIPHLHGELVEVLRRSPQAVVSLISALAFHELTTQIPAQIWITLPRGAWVPKFAHLPVVTTHVSGKSYQHGIERHSIDGRKIKVYSPAKTVADCFKFRRKVGLDVAIEALKDVLDQNKATPAELMEAAEVNRVGKVIGPYLEALI